MFTDKGHFTEFQYLGLGEDIEGTLCGHNGEPEQFTGLKDKNNKEIHEGDIIYHSFHRETFRVVFNDLQARFEANYIENPNEKDRLLKVDSVCYEIIGNIHEHPDLLK